MASLLNLKGFESKLPVCSIRFRTFKEGSHSPSSNTLTTVMGTSSLASSQSPSRWGGTTSSTRRRFHGEVLGGTEETLNIPPGLYGFVQLQETLEGASPSATHTLEVNKVNGLITLAVASGRGVLLSDGLLTLLGLDDGLGGVWLNAGVYTDDRAINFATRQMLWIHLGELNTAENIVDRDPSTLLTSIGLVCHAFGDIGTVRVECPEYKRLRVDTVSELKVSIRDASGKAISNHDLPIHITLRVSKHEHLRLRGLPRD